MGSAERTPTFGADGPGANRWHASEKAETFPKCSFCGKSQKQVKKLIAGPGVYICDECIDLCNEIIEEELAESSELGLDHLPKPREIFDFLENYVVGQDTAKKSSRSPCTTTTSASRR